MRRLLPRQRAAVALAIAFTVGTMGAALAGPETVPGGNPNILLDVSPGDGDNLPSPATITVTGTGFGANSIGNVIQCTFDAAGGFDVCSQPLATFQANSSGAFTQTVQVASSFQSVDNTTVNCLVVACFVQANQNSSGNIGQHHISFAGGSGTTTTTSSTVAPTTTSSTVAPTTTSSTVAPTTTSSTVAPTTTSSTVAPTTTSSTVAPTTTSSTVAPTTTSSTVAPTTSTSTPGSTTSIPGTTTTLTPSQCAQLQQAQAQFNAQVDASIAAVNASGLSAAQKAAVVAQLQAIRAQGNAQISQALGQSGCSVAAA